MKNVKEVLVDITVGSDPEVFVTRGGRPTSAIGLIGGSKANPRKCARGALQEDNVLAELNTDPARTKEEFALNISTVLGELRGVLLSTGHDISIITSHEYDMEWLEEQGRAALEFGCGGEWSAWVEDMLPRPEGASTGLRTAGGHVHVGYDDPWEAGNYTLARLLDVVLGVPSILLDSDTRRRSLYGSAGSLRHKPYGMEYRSLSNFWLSSTNLQHWVFDRVKWGCANLPELDELLAKAGDVQHIINTGDQGAAARVVNTLKLEMP